MLGCACCCWGCAGDQQHQQPNTHKNKNTNQIKVGGLGDVVTALGRAVKEEGHLVEVVLPKYAFFNQSPMLGGMTYETEFEFGGTRVYVCSCVVEGLRTFFLEPKNGFFDTPTVYGRNDDEVRFDFFCRAALEFLLQTGRQPDIIHCHDWSTAHVCAALNEGYKNYGLSKPVSVFTIHNLNYGQKKIAEAAYHCARFTTVSPTYAFEIGGQPAVAPHAHKMVGIRNGIDPELWAPDETNAWLPRPFTANDAEEGKAAARGALRGRLGLTGWGDKFVVAVVSRLTGQKGVHLIKHAASKVLERGGQFVLLGSAPDPKVQAEFDGLAATLGSGEDARFVFAYDEPLSHLIYAAADMVLVPSMFEPCGLTQMIAMRYGAVPVVRHTGGLRDTVFDVDTDKARAAWEVAGSADWVGDKLDATNGFAFEVFFLFLLLFLIMRSIHHHHLTPQPLSPSPKTTQTTTSKQKNSKKGHGRGRARLRAQPRRRRLLQRPRLVPLFTGARDAAGLVVEPAGDRLRRALLRGGQAAAVDG